MIGFSQVCKSYGDHSVLQNVSLKLEEGKIYSLRGKSGAGKTTFLRLLAGLETPDQGKIIGLEGKRVSMVFQEDRLCENLSVSKNIRMVAEETDDILQSIHESLMFAGLEGCGARPVRELSGGMKRRTAILRALYAESSLLLFDEASSGLDTESLEKMIQLIQKMRNNRTIFWAAHDLREMDLIHADTVLCVENASVFKEMKKEVQTEEN